MPLVSPDALHAALETVIDPEIRKPVTELGMVESVAADDAGHVAVTILLTVAACPLKDTLTRDTTFAGVDMREGDKVVMWYISANRDEAHFAEPYRFDITREPNEQGGFGTGGPHFCLGANLARREITLMFEELFRWLPDLRITSEPDRLQSAFINGIKRMRCSFTPTKVPADLDA